MCWLSRAVVGLVAPLFIMLMNAYPVSAATAPNPRNEQWWFAAWELQTKVWSITQGNGVTVAVLDTGVQADIPELTGVVLRGTDATGGGGDGRTDVDETPTSGHGTGMATLIAGQGGPSRFVGVAPAAEILPIVVHRGEQTADAAGIRYAVDRGAKVINLSQFTPAPCPVDVQSAVAYAIEHDVVIVAGAGNTGHADNMPGFPANCAGVLAVGAIDNQMRAWPKTQRQPYVTVAAPGVYTGGVDKNGQFYRSNGTSDASALTSAAVALVRSKYPQMPAREVVQRIVASTRDAGPPGKDEQTGYGVVRPLHALQDEVPKNAPNPVFDAYDQWAAANGKKADKGGSAAGEQEGKGFKLSPFAVVLIASAGLTVLVLIVIFIARGFRKPRQQVPGGAAWGPNSGSVPQQPGPPQQFGPPSFGQPPAGGPQQAGWPQPSGPGTANPAQPPSQHGPADQR